MIRREWRNHMDYFLDTSYGCFSFIIHLFIVSLEKAQN